MKHKNLAKLTKKSFEAAFTRCLEHKNYRTCIIVKDEDALNECIDNYGRCLDQFRESSTTQIEKWLHVTDPSGYEFFLHNGSQTCIYVGACRKRCNELLYDKSIPDDVAKNIFSKLSLAEPEGGQ